MLYWPTPNSIPTAYTRSSNIIQRLATQNTAGYHYEPIILLEQEVMNTPHINLQQKQ